MSGPIQTLPKGLLDLLALKQMGKNPSQLLDTVQPTLDLREQYMVPLYKTESTLGPITLLAAINQGASSPLFQAGGANFTVPANKIWYVVDWSVNAPAAAADFWRFCLVTFDGLAVGNGPHVRGVDFQDNTTARARNVQARIDRPFWVQGGALFSIRFDDTLNAAATTFTSSITVVELIP